MIVRRIGAHLYNPVVIFYKYLQDNLTRHWNSLMGLPKFLLKKQSNFRTIGHQNEILPWTHFLVTESLKNVSVLTIFYKSWKVSVLKNPKLQSWSQKKQKNSLQNLNLQIIKFSVLVSVSYLRLRKSKSRYRSRECKPSLANHHLARPDLTITFLKI